MHAGELTHELLQRAARGRANQQISSPARVSTSSRRTSAGRPHPHCCAMHRWECRSTPTTQPQARRA